MTADPEDRETANLIAGRAYDRAWNALTEALRTQELALYLTDREAWIEQTAAKTGSLLASWRDAVALESWQCIGHDYRMAVWKHMDADQRARIKRLVAEKPGSR